MEGAEEAAETLHERWQTLVQVITRHRGVSPTGKSPDLAVHDGEGDQCEPRIPSAPSEPACRWRQIRGCQAAPPASKGENLWGGIPVVKESREKETLLSHEARAPQHEVEPNRR